MKGSIKLEEAGEKPISSTRLTDEEFQKHKIVKAVTEGKHPAVQTFGYQDISIQWAGYDRYPIGMNTRYRLCYECQHELLEIIGEFFFKNIPSEQPIKT